MLPLYSGILVEAISTAFTSLQRQSISLPLFLQCPNLHQSRFFILICTKTAAKAYVLFQKQPPEMFCQKNFLKFSQISQENTCVGFFFNTRCLFFLQKYKIDCQKQGENFFSFNSFQTILIFHTCVSLENTSCFLRAFF